MATLDITRPAYSPHEKAGEEGASLMSELFGLRNLPLNAWFQQGEWLRTAVSNPESDVILRHDELTIDRIRQHRGRVKIAVTDEGADRVAALLRGEVPASD